MLDSLVRHAIHQRIAPHEHCSLMKAAELVLPASACPSELNRNETPESAPNRLLQANRWASDILPGHYSATSVSGMRDRHRPTNRRCFAAPAQGWPSAAERESIASFPAPLSSSFVTLSIGNAPGEDFEYSKSSAGHRTAIHLHLCRNGTARASETAPPRCLLRSWRTAQIRQRPSCDVTE
ncbi:hypothetical protein V1282_001689 [Nitrobacteraceae bacterium AZCC 2146]